MFVYKGLAVIVALLCVPVVMGVLVTSHMEDRYKGHLIANWVFGIALMFCELQIMAVPFIIADFKFHTLFYVYVSVIVIQTIFVLSRSMNDILGMVNAIPKKVKKIGLIGAVVLLSIMMQAFCLFYFQHTDDDDARFVPSAVAAVEKDMMFEENPVTGEMMYSRISEVFKDMISPWIMFWAIVSKMSLIHPAILMHTIVPLFFIPIAYAVYWLLAGFFFGDDTEKKIIFLGLVSSINIFSGYSVFNSGAFLLFRVWQGKAMFASIFAPLLVLIALRMFDKERTKTFWDYALITLVCCAASLTSGFGIILTALFFGIISVIYGIYKKTPKCMVYIWISMIPCIIYGFLYAFGVKLFI